MILKTVLVTGFNGFIGSHLIPVLTSEYNLIGISNSKNNTTKIRQIKKNISSINDDDIPEKVSTIIHLAAISDVMYCERNPIEASNVNIIGTQKILELARKKDADVIFLSTSHVFGTPKKIPINEDDEKNPQTIYGGTKLCGEVLCNSYSSSYDLNVAVCRLFSIYGPNSPIHSVIHNIIEQILVQKTVQLGNVSAKRDFLYVDDVVNAILLLIKKNHGFSNYNIGGNTSHSIEHIFKTLQKISGKNTPLKILKSKLRKNDVPEIISNTNKITSLGWQPRISLNDGLKLTYDWYAKKIKK